MDEIDLVCAPDILRVEPGALALNPDAVIAMQAAVLRHCQHLNNRFAILDAMPDLDPAQVLQQRRGLSSANGALYYPWVRVPDLTETADSVLTPPCGHVAGVYARSDHRIGVHKAPANDVLEGVSALAFNPTQADQAQLNPESVNCLRAFRGRGIRVWGARTLSQEPAWLYINVRRLFLNAVRWIESNMRSVAFESNDTQLWARIGRELTTYFNHLFERGALKGRTAREAFYIKCDAETNPPDGQDKGEVVAEIGLAPALPNEFVVVRIIHGTSGVTITGPTRPA